MGRFLLAGGAALFFLAAPALAFIGGEELILRPQAVTPGQDLSYGRYGAGDLTFDEPMDVATDADDRVYILDAGNRRIQVADEKGDFVGKWSLGSRFGTSKDRGGVLALDERRKLLYVLDRSRPRVLKYSLSGELLATFGEEGLGRGTLDAPADVAVDAYGMVYVLDRGRRRVLKYTPEGVFRLEFGGGGGRDGLTDPVSLVCHDETIGFVLVVDAGTGELVRFDRDGSFRDRTALPAEAGGGSRSLRARMDRWGGLFLLDAGEKKLIKSSQRGGTLIFSLAGGDKARVEEVGGFAIDRKGRVYATDLLRNRVHRFLLEQP